MDMSNTYFRGDAWLDLHMHTHISGHLQYLNEPIHIKACGGLLRGIWKSRFVMPEWMGVVINMENPPTKSFSYPTPNLQGPNCGDIRNSVTILPYTLWD
jgi:hypothetical protein